MIGYNSANKREWESAVGTAPPVALTPKEGKMQTKSIPQLTLEQEDKFWSRVVVPYQPSCCWEWQGSLDDKGYGQTWIYGHGSFRAHRVAYALLIGPMPDGQVTDHLCRNHRCVNPDHIELVPGRVNILRGYGQAALHARKTHCNHGHEFTPDNIQESKYGWRRCLTCKREGERQKRFEARGIEWTPDVPTLPRQLRSHCKNGHEFTPENTYWASTGKRNCRACARLCARRIRAKAVLT